MKTNTIALPPATQPRRFPGSGYEDKTSIMVQLGNTVYLSEVN